VWRTSKHTKVKILSYDDWESVIEGVMYVRRVNVRLNGRAPLSGNSCAIKMSNGDVLYYNAVPPSPDTVEFLKDLLQKDTPQSGHTIHFIVPNDLTINFVADYFPLSNVQTFPTRFYAFEHNKHFLGLLAKWIKMSDSSIPVQFVNEPEDFPSCIRDDFDVELVTELKTLNEIVLHHRASRIAIMGDITQNVVPGKSLPTDITGFRVMEKYMEFKGKIGNFGVVNPKLIVCDDSQQLLKKLQRIAGWKFTGLVMARGEIVRPGDIEAVNIEFLKKWMGALAQRGSLNKEKMGAVQREQVGASL